MRNFDFSPLYRSTVGFDRMLNLLDASSRVEQLNNWPPYNIERLGEDQYRITMAVAGFSPEELTVTAQANALIVTGQKKGSDDEAQYLHRGIATRTFKQSFDLADHVVVTGANLDHGLLTIALKREVPEALKPRRIEISAASQGDQPKTIEHAKAA